jgi:uncharacterized protein YbjT (DUF2867 family)
MSKKLKVLVTGATGQQGGAVARSLIRRGHSVRAFTRKPDSDGARQLAGLGAEIAEGGFTDGESLIEAARGVDTAFLMGTPFEAGIRAESDQGIQAVDVLKAARPGHVIYASVASADKKTGIPHFESKYLVEQHLAASGLAYTISAPVFFMENHVSPWSAGPLVEGKLAMALLASRPLQQVAVADIGEFVASLVERRDAVFGRRIDIAGDALTGIETAEILTAASGRPIRYEAVPVEFVRQQNEDLYLMFEWFDRVGFTADVAGLRREFGDVNWHRLRDWAREQDWSFLDPARRKAVA